MTAFIGIAMISAISAYVLDTLGFGGTRLYMAFVSVIMLILTFENLEPLIGEIMDFAAPEFATDIGTAALRVLGIGYVGGFFSDFCSELGVKRAADGILLFSRVEMLGVILPYFLDILRVVGELLK